MISYSCDGCGRKLSPGALRYTVKVDVRAAYEEIHIGLAELVRDHRQELIDLIKKIERDTEKTPSEIEETVYKAIHFDLCPACQRAYIKDPLHFHPDRGEHESDIDIDSFLRSLGYGETE